MSASWWERTRRVAAAGIAADRPIVVAALLYFAACAIYVGVRAGFHWDTLGATAMVYAVVWVQQYLVLFPVILLGIGWGHIVVRLNMRRSLAYRTMFGPERIGRLLAGMVLLGIIMVPFHTAFNTVKTLVPLGQGFPFDTVFADLDRALFFGHEPFAVLFGVVKNEWVLRALELNYSNFWFVVCFGMVYWMAVSPRLDGVRTRDFISFLLTWGIVGNVLATLFASAGPVYYGEVTGDFARFAEQVDFLQLTAQSPGSAAFYQNYLWSLYLSGQPGLGSGISAFPSMHLALITLNALFVRELLPKLMPFVWAYVGVLLVSSVYLGWHYAVDGIGGMLAALAIYWAVKRVMATRFVLWHRKGEMEEAPR